MNEHNYANQNELRFIGMSRSGNHAILHWLIRQIIESSEGSGGSEYSGRPRVCWVHCPEPGHSPYWTARQFDNGERFFVNYADFDVEQEKWGRCTPKDWFILNYEDTFLRAACGDLYERHHDEWVGPSRRRFDLLLLRDPFNLFASRTRIMHHTVPPRTGLRIWKQHARQFINGARMLRHNGMLVLYNRWCDDREYRQSICRRLGIPFTDAGRQDVPAVMGGSSFDGLRYQGDAARMLTASRWQHCIDHNGYLELFDKETLDLAREIFGPLSALDAIARRQSSLLAV